MSNQQKNSNPTKRILCIDNAPAAEQAVIIGSSIAGLLAARALVDEVDSVTIIDRDQLTDHAQFRSGVPQARHAHTLHAIGQMVLERMFPGLMTELAEAGALQLNPQEDIVFFEDGVWHRPRGRASQTSIASSRPMLEAAVYKRMASHPKVNILQEYEVTGLKTDESGQRVAGVRLRSRRQPAAGERFLPASLVIDASGRMSHAPKWLEELGFSPPDEIVIDAHVGYATRIYRRPAETDPQWKSLYVTPTPPDGTRGGIIIPAEDDLWYVTLIGVADDYPPTDEEGFLEFARSLPVPDLYEAIRDSEPVGKPYGFRRTANRVRRYDDLDRYLEGFIVLGDAVFAMNPIYAQGMAAAALGSQTLQRSLKEYDCRTARSGLSANFQKRLTRDVSRLWKIATQKDWLWPKTEIPDENPRRKSSILTNA